MAIRRQRTRVEEGALVAIPLAPDQYGLAMVLFASREFRSVILLGIFDVLLTKPVLPEPLPAVLLRPFIYTGSQGIGRDDEWRLLGSTQLDEEARKVPLHIVAGDVYKGDEFIRHAREKDWSILPQMSVQGGLMARRSIARLLKHRGAKELVI